MIEPIEDVFMMRPQRDEDANHDIHNLVLQTLDGSSPWIETLKFVTRGQDKILLQTIQDPK